MEPMEPIKKCKNPLCDNTNPTFYKNRGICKACFIKQVKESRNKNKMPASDNDVIRKKKIEEIERTMQLLHKQLTELKIR